MTSQDTLSNSSGEAASSEPEPEVPVEGCTDGLQPLFRQLADPTCQPAAGDRANLLAKRFAGMLEPTFARFELGH